MIVLLIRLAGDDADAHQTSCRTAVDCEFKFSRPNSEVLVFGSCTPTKRSPTSNSVRILSMYTSYVHISALRGSQSCMGSHMKTSRVPHAYTTYLRSHLAARPSIYLALNALRWSSSQLLGFATSILRSSQEAPWPVADR